MGELKKLIVEEFGEKVLELIDPLDKGWSLPLQTDSLDEVADTICQSNIMYLLDGIHNLAHEINREKRSFFQEKGEECNDDVLLAARLYGHDVKGINTVLNGCTLAVVIGSKKSPVCLNTEISYLTNFRLFGITMAYLASNGNEKFSAEIPAYQVGEFLKDATKKRIKIDNQIEGCISSPEYIALCEIVKNAPGSITLAIAGDDDYVKLSIRDKGRGILDENGNPLPKKLIPEIFYGRSTTGEGIGLQVARRLLELRGGNIELLTTRKGEPTLWYAPTGGKDDKCVEVTPHLEIGSIFNLYISRKQ